MRKFLFAAAGLGLAASTGFAQDLLDITPKNEYTIEVDNQYVRVLHVKRAPHAAVPMHEHKYPFVVVYMKDDDTNNTMADGKVVRGAHKAGEAIYNQLPLRHKEQHVFDGPLDVMLIELKSKPPAVTIPAALDAVKQDPANNKVLLENDLVRVVRSTRGPHAKAAMHQHPAFVNVVMTDLDSRATLDDGTVQNNKRKPGEVVYRPGIKHAVENLTDKQTLEIQIELK
jgi:quercetin dioxygenase-like cupin family protein